MVSIDSFTIDAQVLNLIAELDELKGRWEALGRLAPEELASLRKVATIESVGSSTRIEGARLSDHRLRRCWRTWRCIRSAPGMRKRWLGTLKP